MPILHISGIVNDSIVDGPGLRVVVFTQGCDKNCRACHNPEARKVEGGAPYTPEEVFEKIRGNPLISGVTFSGGEPLLQSAALIPLARLIKGAGLHLAIYTGDTFEEIMSMENASAQKSQKAELLSLADILVDGPFIQEQKTLTLPFRGSSNQRILDLPRSLAAGAAIPCSDPAWFAEKE
jgi:anaerobic ribonucleoside-triphosphate reductase activating protein